MSKEPYTITVDCNSQKIIGDQKGEMDQFTANAVRTLCTLYKNKQFIKKKKISWID